MSIKENYEAFPVPGPVSLPNEQLSYASSGMSLRAYIAIHAPLMPLSHLIAENELYAEHVAADAKARVAYADALLKALNGD